jgi:F-type H+-transporting ATPase subunit epsilon
MILHIFLPDRVLLTREVTKVVAEGEEGSFGIRPRHVDYASPLVPGILAFTAAESEDEQFVAIDEGLLVKQKDHIFVSVRDAVFGPDLGELEQTVRDKFAILNEQEQAFRLTVDRLEADFVRRFARLSEDQM